MLITVASRAAKKGLREKDQERRKLQQLRPQQKDRRADFTTTYYGQSELKMEAAGTAMTLHFSVHLSAAGKSPQLDLDCSQ